MKETAIEYLFLAANFQFLVKLSVSHLNSYKRGRKPNTSIMVSETSHGRREEDGILGTHKTDPCLPFNTSCIQQSVNNCLRSSPFSPQVVAIQLTRRMREEIVRRGPLMDAVGGSRDNVGFGIRDSSRPTSYLSSSVSPASCC